LGLGEALKGAITRFMSRGRYDKEVLEELIRDIQRALLSADVHVELVMEISDKIRRKAAGVTPPPGVSRREMVFKIVFDELVQLLGGAHGPYKPLKKPTVLMVVGIQGSGKTTSVAKLAHYFSRNGYRVGVVCADTYRPAAYQQLQQLLAEKNIPVLGETESDDAVGIAKKGVEILKQQGAEIIIVDTAGRHKDQESLMSELKEIQKLIQPDEVVLVLDSTIGQRARSQAEAFHKVAGLGWVMLTKMDTSARAGGALSAVAATGAPVRFIGTGERLEDIETFSADRYLTRLLGMPDLVSLVERVKLAEVSFSESSAERMLSGRFTIEEMVRQARELTKMGPLEKIISALPIPGAKTQQLDDLEAQVRRWEAIVNSMTPEERRDPTIIDSSRARRIARGAGVSEKDVKRLIKQYSEMRRLMKRLKRDAGRIPKGLLEGLMRRGIGGTLEG
jgi:signal recognition particle subunit SRP54